MLAVRVIVLREIAEGLNRKDEASLYVEGQVCDPSRHYDLAADEGAAEIQANEIPWSNRAQKSPVSL